MATTQEKKPINTPNIEYKVTFRDGYTIIKNPEIANVYIAKKKKGNLRIVSIEEVSKG
jgi:hypothetical protein